ncbi:MAG: PilN domain-containing protein [Deltaproteobacteria bacterium]|nr:PilN domain-containing protein [Deltaproteobacteria bacterium]
MIKINLIGEGRRPTAVRKRRDLGASIKKENLGNYMFVAGLILGLLPLGAEWWVLKSREADKEAQAEVLKEEYDLLKPIIAQVNEFKKKKAVLTGKIETINNLKLNQKGPVQVMDRVSRALPELVWLNSMEVKAAQIILKGQARNENAVAAFIDNLDQVEEFQEPSLAHMRETRGGVYDFRITLGYNLVKPKAETTQAAGA